MSSKRQRARIGAVVLILILIGAGCGIDAVATGGGAGPAQPDASVEGGAHLPEAGPGVDAEAEAGVDASGCVADLQLDPLSCGRCGHSCLGGECKAGTCAPVVLLNGEPGLGAVALTATTIFVAVEDSGVIRSLPIAGGAATDVHPTGHAPHDLVVDGDRLFWSDQFGAGMHIFTPAPVTATLASGAVSALAKTGSGVYMIAFAQGDVTYWTRDFSSSQAFTNAGASPAVVVDGANAYWSAGKQIRRVPYGAGSSAVENVVVGLAAAPTSMAITPTHVYWATPSLVQRATIKAGTGWTVATLVTGESLAASLTVDASGIYWLDLTTGALRHAPLAGGTAETLATFLPQRLDAAYPRQIALSATAIYVASTSDGTLSRLAK